MQKTEEDEEEIEEVLQNKCSGQGLVGIMAHIIEGCVAGSGRWEIDPKNGGRREICPKNGARWEIGPKIVGLNRCSVLFEFV